MIRSDVGQHLNSMKHVPEYIVTYIDMYQTNESTFHSTPGCNWVLNLPHCLTQKSQQECHWECCSFYFIFFSTRSSEFFLFADIGLDLFLIVLRFFVLNANGVLQFWSVMNKRIPIRFVLGLMHTMS